MRTLLTSLFLLLLLAGVFVQAAEPTVVHQDVQASWVNG